MIHGFILREVYPDWPVVTHPQGDWLRCFNTQFWTYFSQSLSYVSHASREGEKFPKRETLCSHSRSKSTQPSTPVLWPPPGVTGRGALTPNSKHTFFTVFYLLFLVLNVRRKFPERETMWGHSRSKSTQTSTLVLWLGNTGYTQIVFCPQDFEWDLINLSKILKILTWIILFQVKGNSLAENFQQVINSHPTVTFHIWHHPTVPKRIRKISHWNLSERAVGHACQPALTNILSCSLETT